MNSGFIDQTGCGVSVCWPHVLISELLQSSHNGAFSTVKELSEIFGRTIRTLVYDLHQFIHNFKAHAHLQGFALCNAWPDLQLLKPLFILNMKLSKRLLFCIKLSLFYEDPMRTELYEFFFI